MKQETTLTNSSKQLSTFIMEDSNTA